MILTYDQMGDLLESIAQEFPDAFFQTLSGGIQLEQRGKQDPEFPSGEVYVLGEYCRDMLGQYIVLYYGSFVQMLRDKPESVWREELFATIAHEFTHHLEGAAGLHALEDKDEEFVRRVKEQSAPPRGEWRRTWGKE